MLNILIRQESIAEEKKLLTYLNSTFLEKEILFYKDSADLFDIIDLNKMYLLFLDIKNTTNSDLYGENSFIKKCNIDVVLLIDQNIDKSLLNYYLRLGIADCILKPLNYNRFIHSMEFIKKRQYFFFSDHFIVTQQTVDQYVFSYLPTADANVFVCKKGIDKLTLLKIWRFIKNMNMSLEVSNISQVSGISQVIVRKYLEFLVERKILSSYKKKGFIGRPSTVYLLEKNIPLDFI